MMPPTKSMISMQSLAVRSPERFSIEGIVATQFSHGGLSTVQQSYNVIHDLLTADKRWGTIRVEKGGKPLRSMTEPEDSGCQTDY